MYQVIKNLYQWSKLTFSAKYIYTGNINFLIKISLLFSLNVVAYNAPNYPVIGIAIQSNTTNTASLKVWGVNDASKFNGFYWSIISK